MHIRATSAAAAVSGQAMLRAKSLLLPMPVPMPILPMQVRISYVMLSAARGLALLQMIASTRR